MAHPNFNMPECLTPFIKKDAAAGSVFTLPCGRCPTCTARRVSGWSFRLMQEEKHSTSAQFITLTYDIPPMTPKGFMNLNKRDPQLFMKKLRKVHSQKLKYYLVGEYGGHTYRPHYHLILFNAKVELIQPAWIHGHVHYGTVSGASVGYTLKYISKPARIPLHQNDDRQPEFALMSKGLGSSYLTPAMVRYHHGDLLNRMVIPIEDNKKIAMPRYFKDKIYNEDQRAAIAAHSVITMGEKLEKFYSSPDFEMNNYKRQQAIQAAFERAKLSSLEVSKNKL